ncbi:MAG TPA: hypothetical protein VLK36_04865 [Gaiellaceae bacterium]|nr:hypothetical protein [Gaiellaceae bacterium]
MSQKAAPRDLERCEIVWWRGYVKGRFLAYAASGPEPVGESPAIRWRSSSPPGPTEEAVAALDALTAQLSEAGWKVEERDGDPWFGLRLSRPAAAKAPVSVRPAPMPVPAPVAAPTPEPPLDEGLLDEALLVELRAELADARDAARRERDRRLDAEAEVLRLKEPPPRRPATQPLSAWALLGAYAIVVAAATLVGLLGFESAYGAVVAGLTTLAVVVAVDSWIVARRRRAQAAS